MNYTLGETMNAPGNRKMEMFVTKLPSNFTLKLCKAGYLVLLLFFLFFFFFFETNHMQTISNYKVV